MGGAQGQRLQEVTQADKPKLTILSCFSLCFVVCSLYTDEVVLTVASYKTLLWFPQHPTFIKVKWFYLQAGSFTCTLFLRRVTSLLTPLENTNTLCCAKSASLDQLTDCKLHLELYRMFQLFMFSFMLRSRFERSEGKVGKNHVKSNHANVFSASHGQHQ